MADARDARRRRRSHLHGARPLRAADSMYIYLSKRRPDTRATCCHLAMSSQPSLRWGSERVNPPFAPWRPRHCFRAAFAGARGRSQSMSVQPSHLRNPDRTANHASPSAPLAHRETRSASPPVSQTKSCCFSFNSFIFMVLLLMADGPSTTLHAPSTTFCMDSLRCAPCDACAVFSHTYCMTVRTSAIRYSPSCGRVLRLVVQVTLK